MANLIKQKFLEGIDSSKFKIEQGGAIKAVNASGQLVDVFMFDTANEVVKVFGNEEVAVASYVDALMSQEVVDRNAAINSAITDLINGAPQALDTLKELADALGDKGDAIAALVSQLAQETSDREDADAALSGRLDTLEGADNVPGSVAKALKDAKDYTDQEVSTEEARAMGVESGLNSRLTTAEGEIDTLQTDLDAAEQAITDEVTRAMGVESGLNNRLTTAEGEIDTLQTDLDAAEQAIIDEVSRAMGVESGLNSRLTTAESEIDTLQSDLDAAEDAIDAEEARAMGVESGLNSRLTTAEGEIDTLQTDLNNAEDAIDAEEARAMGVESGLNSRLNTLEGADTVEGSVAKAEKDAKDYADSIMATEQAARQAADSDLQDAIDAEEVARAAAVSAEETRALAAEAGLQSDIDDLDAYAQEIRADLDQEILDRTADFEAEEARAMAAEADLQDAIDAEVTARTSAVTAEETARIAGDANLQSQINNILSNVDPAALDSLTEVVAAFEAADSDLNDAITALGTGSQSALAQEIADRIADVNAEETRALAAEAALQAEIDAEETARAAAVSAEQTRAETAEAGLQDSIDAEVAAREADVDAEEARAIAAEGVLQDAIDAEQAARIADVDAEEARAIAAEGVLQGAIDAEEAAREAEDLTFFKHDGSRALSGNMDANDKQINSARSVSFVNSDNQDPSYEYNSSINMDSILLHQQSLEVTPGSGGQQYLVAGLSKQFGFSNNSGMYTEYDAEGNTIGYGWGTDVSASSSIGGFRINHFDANPENSYYISANFNSSGLFINDALNANENVWSISNYNSETGYPTGDVLFSSATKKMTISADSNELVLKSLGSSNGVKMIGNSIKLYSDAVNGNGEYIAFEPTHEQDVTTKAYVDSLVVNSKTFAKEMFEIDSSSELTSVSLSGEAVESSIVVFVNRLALHEGMDYSVSVVGGVSVITWEGDFATGGAEAIEEGDVINVTYMI